MKHTLRLAQGIALTGLLAAAPPAARAASGNWNVDAAGNWSTAASWTPAAVPGTAAGDVVGLTFNITAARTITIDTTSRIVGTLNIGDPTTSFFAYTLASSGAAVTLTFNNSGSSANLVQATTTAADVISAPLVLADNLVVNNTGSGGLTLSGIISGSGKGITKNGSGTLTLGNGANTYSGKTLVNAGIMRITGTTSLGPVPGAYTADQLTLNGGSLMNNTSDVILAANQGLTLGASGGGIQAGWSRPVTVNSIITGPGGLNLLPDATPGAISLNAANTYTGPTVVGNTTANAWAWLLVNGSLDPASTVTVNPNGLLGGNGTVNGTVTVNTNGSVGPGGVGVAGTLTVNNNVSLSAALLNVDLADVTTEGAGVNDLLQVNGNLTLAGTITVNPSLLKGALATGTYRLINYTGTLDASTATLVCSNPQFGATFDLSTPGQVNMTIANGTPLGLAWGGANGPFWNVTLTNWLATGSATKFTQGDAVTFDDTGSYLNPVGLYQVYLTGPASASGVLLPASVAINTTNNFVLTSIGTAGRLGGGMGLYKSGSGMLTMAHGNDNFPNIYTGPTVVSEGVLKINNARALGPFNAGGIFATNTGTFDVNGQNMGVKPLTIQGAGFGGQGAVVNTGAGQNNAFQVMNMAGDATVGGPGRFDLRGTVADTYLSTGGQPYKLTKVGANQFSLVNAVVDPALGDIDVLQGVFSFEGGSTSLGDPSKSITVGPAGRLLFWSTTNRVNKQFIFSGGATPNLEVGSGAVTTIGPMLLNADTIFNIGGTSLTVEGPIGGAGGLTKIGASPLTLNAVNSYVGDTTVSAGTLTLGAGGWLGLTPTINVASGAFLDVSVSSLYLSLGQTLAGSGTVRGSVSVPTGSAISPGGTPGTLTITNELTMSGGKGNFELGSSATTAAASDRISAGQLTATGVSTLNVIPLGALDLVNPYTLITNLGTALPSGSEANFTVSSPSRYTFSVVPTDATAGKAVQVQVSGGAPASLVWQGDAPGNPTKWDTGMTPNWLNAGSPDAFFAGDAVLFDDSAVGTTAELVGKVQPSFVRFANAIKSIHIAGNGSLITPSVSGDGPSDSTISNYADNTFLYGITNNVSTLMVANIGANNFGTGLRVNGGSLSIVNSGNNAMGPLTVNAGDLTIGNAGVNTIGAIALNAGSLRFTQPLDTTVSSVITGSGTLIKQAGYQFTLSGASTAFNGPIQVDEGILRAGIATALGTTVGGTTIGYGATLDVNAFNLGNELVTVSGSGFGGRGAIVNNSATAQQNALHNVLLVGDTTFGGVGRWDIRTNATGFAELQTGGNPYNLTKVGANYIPLVSTIVDPALGDIDVQQGGFGYEVATTGLGDPNRTLNVGSNAYFLIYASAKPLNKRITLQGGALMYSQNAANTIWSPIELPNALASIQTDVNLTLTNQVSGPGTLQKIGTATLFLNASNNLTSSILATNGTLTISHPNALGSSGMVYIRRGSVTGGTGTKLGLTGGITTPADTTAHFTTTTVGGDYRCAIGSDGGGLNTWAGPISLNGENIVGFYGTTANPLNIDGPVYTTSGYTGTAFFRGGANGGGTVSGQMTLPTGVMAITDNGVWRFNHPANTWIRSLIAYGRAVLGTDNALCPTAELVLGQSGTSAGTLDLNGFSQEVPRIITVNGVNHLIGSSSTTADSTLIYNGGTNNSVYSAKIVDSVAGGTRKVALTVASGVLVLDGVNTYTGDTLVTGGSLSLSAAGTIATSPLINVGTGATLDVAAKASLALVSGQTLKGNGTVVGSVTAGTGAVVSPGASIGALTFTGSLFLSPGSTTTVELDKSATPANDVINATTIAYASTLQVNNLGPAIGLGDSFKLFNASSYSGNFAAISPATPGPGLAWDTSTLATDGTLRVWAPTLTGITSLPDGNFALTITGAVGQPYSVLLSSDAALPLADWTVLTNGTIPTSPFVFEDLTATNAPLRFYLISTP